MEKIIEENKIYSLQETADLLGLKPRTVALYLKNGSIKARRLGEWKILGRAIINFMLNAPEQDER